MLRLLFCMTLFCLMPNSVILADTTTAPSVGLDSNQIEQVKTVVHDYLVTNPQVLVEASQSLQKQEATKTQAHARVVIVQQAKQIFADPNTPVMGNPKGDVTLVEFFDYQCPHCKDMKAVIAQLLKEDKNLRVLYKELPIFGESSRDASAAALAAAQQGQYLKMHDALLAAENPLNKDKVLAIAKSIGLDINKLTKDMENDSIQQEIEDNFQLAEALKLIGTPTFIVALSTITNPGNTANETAFIPGMPSVADLKQEINQIRQQKK